MVGGDAGGVRPWRSRRGRMAAMGRQASSACGIGWAGGVTMRVAPVGGKGRGGAGAVGMPRGWAGRRWPVGALAARRAESVHGCRLLFVPITAGSAGGLK